MRIDHTKRFLGQQIRLFDRSQKPTPRSLATVVEPLIEAVVTERANWELRSIEPLNRRLRKSFP